MDPITTDVIFTNLVPADTNPALPGMPDPFHRLEMWIFEVEYFRGLDGGAEDLPVFIHHSVIKGKPNESSAAHSQTLRLLQGAWEKKRRKGAGLPTWTRTGSLTDEQRGILDDFEGFPENYEYEGDGVLSDALGKSLGRDNFVGFWHSEKGGLAHPFGAEELTLPSTATVMASHKSEKEVPE